MHEEPLTAAHIAQIIEIIIREAMKLNPEIDVFTGRHGELFIEAGDERVEVNLYG